MVKCYGPLFSFDASGTIADALTFSKWKGRNYARQRVVPANPKSPLQVSMRAMLKFLAQNWDGLSAANKADWADRAKSMNVSNFNAYTSYNQRRWREFQAPSQTDPATENGTLPTATFDSATGGVASIDLQDTITTLGTAWGLLYFRSTSTGFATAISNMIAALFRDATGTIVYTDSGLAAGTYYYNARYFDVTGQLGPEEGEKSATAT